MAQFDYAPEKSGPHVFMLPNGNSITFYADDFGQVTMSIEFAEYLLVRLLGWEKTSPILNEHLDNDKFF